ncbi:hypothetical protein ET495_11665 [Xylanimonas allomyrinae]|uniref:Uncharacterized protein n=1 Tax=Xylanimonas allomyrinae TaxID=2509459 RepID=A0A4P6ETS1_9MICO|nr:hypothetical protein [Xylanimonas allomyrinae]QAY63787.1 hypothetical protein ET495_11665 [Xylanimonas allomyrinae]
MKVPDGFPVAQVPLQSTSLRAAERSGDAWNLTVDGHADQIADAVSKLKDAGFAVVGQSRTDAGPTYSLSSTEYSVRVGVSADGKDLEYGVVARAKGDAATPAPDASASPEGAASPEASAAPEESPAGDEG